MILKPFENTNRFFCINCDRMEFIDPKVVTGVLFTAESKIVLIQRNLEPQIGKWTFPAGFVDRGEKVEDAAIREVFEETGYIVALDKLIGVYSQKDDPIILIVYSGQVIGGKLTDNSEVQNIETFSVDKLPILAFERDRKIIQDWNNR
jgi:ADP-ribose pyrophosphatase YjhB (NUDIX family)